MDLRTYLKSLSPDARADFAARATTTLGYLRKAISVGSKFGPELAVAIEQQSDSAVTRKELLPDTWHLIWPELIDAKDLRRDGDAE